jgi:hypothetical protein
MVRVTRLGEFSPIGRLFMYFGLLFENYKSSSNYRAIFSTVKLSIDTDKNGAAFWAILSQTYLVTVQLKKGRFYLLRDTLLYESALRLKYL